MSKPDKNPKGKLIRVASIKIDSFSVTIVGTSPLLVNKIQDESVNEIRAKKEGGPKAKREAIDPKTEWLKSLHVLPSSGKLAGAKGCRYGLPARAIHASIIDACSFVDGITKVQARGAIQVIADSGGLIEIKGKAVCDIQTFPNRMNIGITSHRARFDSWSMTLKIAYNMRVITPDVIVDLLNNAGFAIGLGSRRRQRGDSYGTFEVAA